MRTQKHLENLLEELPCEADPADYYETSQQLLEPLLLCYDSLVISATSFTHLQWLFRVLVLILYCLQVHALNVNVAAIMWLWSAS